MEILIAKIGRDGVPKWYVLKHTDYDGIGAIVRMLYGPRADSVALRPLKNPRRPGRFTILLAVFKHLRRSRSQTTAWRRYDPASVGRSPGVSWITFDEATTTSLEQAAKSRAVSLNSLLLSPLDRAVRETYVEGGDTCWVMPVNMRGAVGLAKDVPNPLSFIHVFASPGIGIEELHRRIGDKLRDSSHWAMWALMHIGKLVGLKRVEAAYVKSHANPHPATGTFSSLGAWQTDRGPGLDAWVISVPTSKTTPIAAGTLVVDGRLGLGLQIHPSLRPTPEHVQRLLNRWAAEIRGVSGVESSAKSASLSDISSILNGATRIDR